MGLSVKEKKKRESRLAEAKGERWKDKKSCKRWE